MAADDDGGAHPVDQEQTGIDDQLHDRRGVGHDPLRLLKDTVQRRGRLLELFLFVFLAGKALDHADPAEVLLYDLIELVVLLKHLLKVFFCPDDQKRQGNP